MRPHQEKQQSKTHLSAYLLQEKVAHSAFSEKRIPFNLRELRWRAFHQALRVGAANPWLQDQKRCKRLTCSGSGPTRSVGTPPLIETVAHFVQECMPAKELWRGLARAFKWPELGDYRLWKGASRRYEGTQEDE